MAAVLTSQGIGLTATLVILLLSGEAGPSQAAIVWGTFAGVCGLAGIGFFYVALARGTMGVIAPFAALIGAGVPVIIAVIGGESVAPGRQVGMGLALVAIVLISLPNRSRDGSGATSGRGFRSTLADMQLAILAGLGFAGFFIGVDLASASGETWWPLAFVRVSSCAGAIGAFLFLIARHAGPSLMARARDVLGVTRLRAQRHNPVVIAVIMLTIGLGDLGGNAFFVLARGADAFSVAVVLSSLYPVVTTILAVILLRERLSPVQLAGAVLATLSIPLLR